MLLLEWLPTRDATLPHAMQARTVRLGRLRLSWSRQTLRAAGQAALRSAFTDRAWSTWSPAPTGAGPASASVTGRSWTLAAEYTRGPLAKVGYAAPRPDARQPAGRLQLGLLLLTVAPIAVSGLIERGEPGELLLSELTGASAAA